MNSEWKMVPSEPTEEMNKAGMRWLTGIQHMRAGDKRNALNEAFKAMAELAPVPPAGEVEVLARVDGMYGDPDAFAEREIVACVQVQTLKIGTELVDRAHVTRLTAENARLQAELGKRTMTVSMLYGDIDFLQSELTKARELLRANATDFEGIRRALASFHKDNQKQWCGYLDDSLGICLFRIKELAAYLTHQSAPAAKCSICNGTGVVGDASIGYDQCFHNVEPAAKGGSK